MAQRKLPSERRRLLPGWPPFEEWFDGHINFHVTLFLEGITAKRLSVITVRNVLSYWTAFTQVLEDTLSHRGQKPAIFTPIHISELLFRARSAAGFYCNVCASKVDGNGRTFIFDRVYSAKIAIAFNIHARKKSESKRYVKKPSTWIDLCIFARKRILFHRSGSASGWRFEVHATTFLAGPSAIHSSQQVWRACWV